MSLITRLDSFDDAIYPRRGLFLAPGGWRFVWHVTGFVRQYIPCRYEQEVVLAKRMYWFAVSYIYGGKGRYAGAMFARGVSINPSTVYDRWAMR